MRKKVLKTVKVIFFVTLGVVGFVFAYANFLKVTGGFADY